MYCERCGRFTDTDTCKKCHILVPEYTKEISEEAKPSTGICLLAYIFPLIYLIISLFKHPKNPRIRAAVKCATASIKFRIVYDISWLVGWFFLTTKEQWDSTIVWLAQLGFIALTIAWPFVIVSTIKKEKRRAVGNVWYTIKTKN